jgi:anhydro-N-acetylmuramic acid kinase
MTDSLLLGLMSGTSMDGIDAALLHIGVDGFRLLESLEYPIPDATRHAIAALCHTGDAEIERMGRLDRELGRLFAEASLALLERSATDPGRVRAIGSHGQTIRHCPPSSHPPGSAFTLQIGDPNTIAEITGITTVADFRRRDIAAGGEGAPLAPAFHAAAFSDPLKDRAVVNIGGIANISVLQEQGTSGFDTGPGNTLLDLWIQKHQSISYDNSGIWAASGRVHAGLLQTFLQTDYLQIPPPKSTGKELFNLAWLEQALEQSGTAGLKPEDIQATLAEFTATTICNGIPPGVGEIYVCGGGAANTDLMSRLQRQAGSVPVASTSALGIDPSWVEAAAFAWLAHRCLEGLAGNVPGVTGASGERILGAVHPGIQK